MLVNDNGSGLCSSFGARISLATLLLISSLTATSGCANLRSSKRADLTPFAADMIAVAGDILYSLEQEEVIYIRDLLVGSEIDSVRIMESRVGAILRGTTAYALEIVTLAQSNLSGSEQAKLLATYLEDAIEPVLQEPAPALNLTVEQLETILGDVRAQEDLFPALGAAQPIVTEVARASGEIIEQAKDAVDKAAEAVEQEIVMENKNVIAMKRKLREEQIESMMNLSFLTDYRSGEDGALDSLLAREPSLGEVIQSTETVSVQDIQAIEERMLYKLEMLGKLRAQLIPDLELYWNKQRELDNLVAAYNRNLRKARVAVIVWALAHERLAAGITDPAKIDILGLSQAAAGKIWPSGI